MTQSFPSAGHRVTIQPETFTLTRAERTRFSITLVRAPSPGRATVLVVPAMGMPAGYYDKLISDLAASGLGASVMELRGHETSGGRLPGWRYNFGYADLVDDVAAAVDHLGRISPDSPICLLGHSLGAHVSSVYAAHHAERVSGLIMVAAGSIHWRLWSVKHLILTQGVALLAHLIGHHPGTRLGFGGREARGVMADWARFARTGSLRFGRPRTDHQRSAAPARSSGARRVHRRRFPGTGSRGRRAGGDDAVTHADACARRSERTRPFRDGPLPVGAYSGPGRPHHPVLAGRAGARQRVVKNPTVMVWLPLCSRASTSSS